MTPYRPFPAPGLWSLLDMLRIYAHQYVILGRNLETAKALFQLISPDDPMTDDERDGLRSCLERLKDVCEKTELTVSHAVIAKALRDLPQTGRELSLLLGPVYQELKDRLFLFVPPHRARYYEENETIPDALKAAFPAACDELLHSGNCYAAGEYTASVFHSMRAAEIALRAVAKHTGIALTKGTFDSADWHTLIELIDKHIEALIQQPKTPARDDELKFFSDANSQFTNFKEAFRKHVAHARDTYKEVPSISILHRTREFLEVLSAKVKE